MTQEDRKQLLLKDLYTRVPYGVKCSITRKGVVRELKPMNNGISMPVNQVCDITLTKTLTTDIINDFINGNITLKPYLRPMSSMTEEEKEELKLEHVKDTRLLADALTKTAEGDTSMRGKVILHFAVDWCNKNHFDFRGLIEKELALEAKEGMYSEGESRKESDIPVPKTVDEAISTLEKILSDEDREYLLKNGAISMHNSLGRWIRNEWGLWAGSELKNELKRKGFEHPDDMSNYIIEEFVKYWNNKI